MIHAILQFYKGKDDGNLVVWRRKASSQEETRCDKFAIPKYKHPACWIATQKGQWIHELGLLLKMPRCNKTKHCSKNEAVTKKLTKRYKTGRSSKLSWLVRDEIGINLFGSTFKKSLLLGEIHLKYEEKFYM